MSVRGLREGEYVKDLSYLEQFRVDIYGMRGELNGAFLDALGTAVAAFFQSKQDAEEMKRDGNG